MIRLLMLLLGSELIQRRWAALAVLGIAWALVGATIFVDALDGDTVIQPHYFGYLLLLEGAVALAAAFAAVTRRGYRFARATVLILPAVAIILQPPHGNLIIAILLGFVLLVDGGFRIASAHVVRFQGWRLSLAAGVVELLFAIATLQPWPTGYEGTIGANVGALLMAGGLATLRLALRLRRLPAGTPISVLLGAALPAAAWARQVADADASRGDLVVHVWTPAGSAGTVARRPLLDRYVAAVDRNGVISTGHAALELKPDLYISHYPAVEIDRSPDDFGRALRATQENDVPGRFQPSYREEADGWCEATEHVRFSQFDAERLRAFWHAYSQDRTYNLTNRNCSSVVAHALDAALEGALSRSGRPWKAGFQAMLNPDLWAAGVLRRRAESMAWTPGLVLDYARLLQVVVEPEPEAPLLAWLRRRRPAPVARIAAGEREV
ncbi:DUF308 domain-containing protein [Roseomonas sp. SSH11]|uniref:DUF308 domain-containing protein n=1 Tax=Pararoseomonas baculiformis TaxID=2820812 RepID=A0ABS4AED2_9PROT|nr:DUF308 domain-containing protein [Pararoseomonas baculiformis]MBP0444910.1 DUF308 domain-containing protein [Pararoseomonas baculiformis]